METLSTYSTFVSEIDWDTVYVYEFYRTMQISWKNGSIYLITIELT